MNHPNYKHDSNISDLIAYDICQLTIDITNGALSSKSFYKEKMIVENLTQDRLFQKSKEWIKHMQEEWTK